MNNLSREDDDRIRQALPYLSAEERQEFDDHCHDISCDNTSRIESDLAGGSLRQIRGAIAGRYRIFRKLKDDSEYWDEHKWDFRDFSRGLPHEPDIIAAALAIRPTEMWEWTVVETWRWIYRYAAQLGIAINDFAEWCDYQDPEASRAFVMADLKSPTSQDTANDNA